MKNQVLTAVCLLFSFIVSFSQEYVAGIRGTQLWTRSEIGPVSGYAIMIRNNDDNNVGVMIVAIKDGQFDMETSPLGAYMSENGTIQITDTTLPSFYVGGKTYTNIHYAKYKAKMNGVFTNIELWQLDDNGIEYSIIALAPVKKNQVINDFIAHNLTLLPLPEVTEDSFIESVESVNAMMQEAGGALMSDGVKMISVVVDKTRKEFIRTYQLSQGVSAEELAELTTDDTTYSMVEYEVKNSPFVKNAVAFGYSIVVVWKDNFGEVLASYTYNF